MRSRAFVLPETPVDELTGFTPLVVVPSDETHMPKQPVDDEHHPVHPRLHPALQDVAGLAVRHARVQSLNWYLHHVLYHEKYGGPPVPTEPGQQFGYVAFAELGYIPETGLLLQKGKPAQEVVMTHDTRRRIWKLGELTSSSPGMVQQFYVDFLLDAPVPDDLNKIYQLFCMTKDPRTRLITGRSILQAKLTTALDPFKDMFRTAYRQGLFPESTPDRLTEAVTQQIGHHDVWRQVARQMLINSRDQI